ncbi:MAG: hypothetical protein HC923_12955 [Myxococcales bacterium]|nr:hypothetical protein [Myxococcales bacterium]
MQQLTDTLARMLKRTAVEPVYFTGHPHRKDGQLRGFVSSDGEFRQVDKGDPYQSEDIYGTAQATFRRPEDLATAVERRSIDPDNLEFWIDGGAFTQFWIDGRLHVFRLSPSMSAIHSFVSRTT